MIHTLTLHFTRSGIDYFRNNELNANVLKWVDVIGQKPEENPVVAVSFRPSQPYHTVTWNDSDYFVYQSNNYDTPQGTITVNKIAPAQVGLFYKYDGTSFSAGEVNTPYPNAIEIDNRTNQPITAGLAQNITYQTVRNSDVVNAATVSKGTSARFVPTDVVYLTATSYDAGEILSSWQGTQADLTALGSADYYWDDAHNSFKQGVAPPRLEAQRLSAAQLAARDARPDWLDYLG